MKKDTKNKANKPRAATYEKPLKFDGTFDEIINISVTGADVKMKVITNQNKKP